MSSEPNLWYRGGTILAKVAGEGEVEDMAGNVYPVRPGDIYVLDQNDRHYLRGGREDLVLVSVFNPPLQGSEKHDLNNPAGSAY